MKEIVVFILWAPSSVGSGCIPLLRVRVTVVKPSVMVGVIAITGNSLVTGSLEINHSLLLGLFASATFFGSRNLGHTFANNPFINPPSIAPF